MLKSRLEQDVRNFHRKFGHPSPSTPQTPPEGWVEMRKRLVLEEASELVEAIQSGSMVKIAREAVDMIYVCLGVLVAYGIPVNGVWRAVHHANMGKTPVPPDQLVKPIKGDGWVSPDNEIQAVIDYGSQRNL